MANLALEFSAATVLDDLLRGICESLQTVAQLETVLAFDSDLAAVPSRTSRV